MYFPPVSHAHQGFGGSYGGMLATWFRIKYPHIMDGAIAGSAPIWVFPGEEPAVDADFFAEGTTYDASEAGGSAPACVDNVRAGWRLLEELSGSARGVLLGFEGCRGSRFRFLVWLAAAGGASGLCWRCSQVSLLAGSHWRSRRALREVC